MFATLVISGGILYTGVSAYNSWQIRDEQRQDQNKSLWQKVLGRVFTKRAIPQQNDALVPSNHKLDDIMIVDQPYTQLPPMDSVDLYIEQSRTLERQLTLATTALGVTIIGSLTFPPLHLVAAPVLVYMGVPAAQDAYDDLAQNRHLGVAIVETTVLLVVLAQGTYMIGTLGFAVYYLGQVRNLLPSILRTNIPTKISVWRNGKQAEISVNKIKQGDLFEVATSEQVYVDGVVVDGEAVVDLKWATGEKELVTKRAGERISATTVISIGKLVVECR